MQLTNEEKLKAEITNTQKKSKHMLILSIVIMVLYILSHIHSQPAMVQNQIELALIDTIYIRFRILAFVSDIAMGTVITVILAISAIVYNRCRQHEYENTGTMLSAGSIFFIIAATPITIILITILLFFMAMCVITLFLLVPQVWEKFQVFYAMSVSSITGIIGGVIWIVMTFDLKKSLKNIKFYQNLK